MSAIKQNKKSSLPDYDFVTQYLKDCDHLLNVLCQNYDVSYDDFAPICSLVNELKRRLSGVQYALS